MDYCCCWPYYIYAHYSSHKYKFTLQLRAFEKKARELLNDFRYNQSLHLLTQNHETKLFIMEIEKLNHVIRILKHCADLCDLTIFYDRIKSNPTNGEYFLVFTEYNIKYFNDLINL